MHSMTSPLDHHSHQIGINTIRFLAVDMVEEANSGHPGAPMGQAAMAYLLWTQHLRFNPHNPTWANRDRFVLSCGHASALLYSLLHLSGYDLSLDELKNFRQLNSKTPGHPEYHLTPGVETTTGPLGQGLGNAVGMAMAQSMLAAQFNKEDFPIFDHRVWAFVSDGDLMEGVASEASSLAGHLCLGNLNVLYDDNEISIDGPTSLTFSEDVSKRYESYGWHVQRVDDGNDLVALDAAIDAAKLQTDRPSLIAVRTHIGFGSPGKQDTSASHGAPLGADEVRATKEALGWPLEPTFRIPEEARATFDQAAKRGGALESTWNALRGSYRTEHPEAAAELDLRLSGQLPADWEDNLPSFSPEDGSLATRSASGKVLDGISGVLPQLTGGSADLTPSNTAHSLWWDLLDLLGLCTAVDPPRCAHGTALDLRIYSRLDLLGRRRTDTPTDQSAPLPPVHSGAYSDSPGRRQRDGRSLAPGHQQPHRPYRLGSDSTETSNPRADRPRCRGGSLSRGLCNLRRCC
jgi:transketolase